MRTIDKIDLNNMFLGVGVINVGPLLLSNGFKEYIEKRNELLEHYSMRTEEGEPVKVVNDGVLSYHIDEHGFDFMREDLLELTNAYREEVLRRQDQILTILN